jgi:ankyrin repeat protein
MVRREPPDARVHVGYWSSEHEPTPPGLPDPRELIDRDWPLRERVRVAQYLRRGQVVAAYHGYSHCRFDCGAPPMVMGTRDLGDERYIWPEGLHHYVEVHAVRLPAEFLEHVAPRLPRLWPWWRLGVWWRGKQLAWAIARMQAAERARAAKSEREALHEAASDGNLARVRSLLAAGRAVDERDEYGMTALALTRSFEVARTLVEAGAVIDPRPAGHITPLQQAVALGDLDWCQYLLERGADINALDKFDRSVLSYCRPSMLRFLLDAGADVRLGAPVCNAARHGDIEMIATLLDAGAELDGPGPNTPLLLAAGSQTGDAALAYLLERGADPTRTDEAGHSALLHAAARQSLTAVHLLVEHGADTTTRPTKVRGGVNALHMAAIGNRGSHETPEVLAYLLELPGLRSQIDIRDEWGRTPLCCAATYGTVADVQVLLAAGANATIPNNDGHTPLAIAHARGLEDMVAALH